MEIVLRKTFKYRIYPTISQVSKLENQFSMCRHLYNWNLHERKEAYKEDKKTISYIDQQNKLPELKKERPWFKSVHSQVLQDVLRRLDNAYKAFFRRVKEEGFDKDAPGFPKFKKRGQWDSITFPQYQRHPENGKIKVSGFGEVKIVYHRDIPETAKIKTLSIVKEADRWFACFSVEMNIRQEPKQALLPPIGVDVGLHDFYYDSNGFHVDIPQFFRKGAKQLARLQRRLAKATKRTKKYRKLQKAIEKCHYRIKCRRNDFLHKTANNLLRISDTVFHEDLTINNMVRKPKPKQDEAGRYLPNGAAAKGGLNKSILDAGWGRFFIFLHYKSVSLGKLVFAVPPHYTSQICSACGEIVKKSLSTRTHVCNFCGFSANRDHNAAMNILRIGMDTIQALGIGLVEAPTDLWSQ